MYGVESTARNNKQKGTYSYFAGTPLVALVRYVICISCDEHEDTETTTTHSTRRQTRKQAR